MSTETLEPKIIQYHITPEKKFFERIVGKVDDKDQLIGNSNNKRRMSPPKQFIPFAYTAYVRKVYKEENGSKVYNGEVEFISTSEAGGEHMELRYLSTCPSLDRKYQEKHGYKPADNNDGVGAFFNGGLVYDVPVLPTNALRRLFMENHPNNGDNQNRPQRSPVYFKIRNGKADMEARKQKMLAGKRISDFRSKVLEDNNFAEVVSTVYKINPSYDLDIKRTIIFEKLEDDDSTRKVIDKYEAYFEELKSKFQFYLDKNVLEVSNKKLIYKADKKPVDIKIEMGADSTAFADVFVKACKENEILTKWLEIEKKLNNN
jgi:hypothetical protein